MPRHLTTALATLPPSFPSVPSCRRPFSPPLPSSALSGFPLHDSPLPLSPLSSATGSTSRGRRPWQRDTGNTCVFPAALLSSLAKFDSLSTPRSLRHQPASSTSPEASGIPCSASPRSFPAALRHLSTLRRDKKQHQLTTRLSACLSRRRLAPPYRINYGAKRNCAVGGVEASVMVAAPIKETKLEMFELGPCADAHDLGFQIGQRFSDLIKSRVRSDLILQHQLLPFAATQQAQPILQELFDRNREKFPNYWNELVGTAAGSGVSLLEILLLNFRKEILPFIPDDTQTDATAFNLELDDPSSDCSDILILDDNMAMVAHNEDANIALIGHTYLVKVTLPNGHSFTAYTYAGELPSCAFGFNSHGVAFTLDSVPPLKEEIQVGGIGRNLISRDLLEAISLGDALRRIRSCNVSVGHSYNLVDVRRREIANVETASRHRVSVRMIGKDPFFHANMYLHLQVQQVQDENSISRHKRAALLTANSEEEMLEILGDSENNTYPIYMIGPKLFTLCTAVIDIDKRMFFIIHGNPRERVVSHKFPIL